MNLSVFYESKRSLFFYRWQCPARCKVRSVHASREALLPTCALRGPVTAPAALPRE